MSFYRELVSKYAKCVSEFCDQLIEPKEGSLELLIYSWLANKSDNLALQLAYELVGGGGLVRLSSSPVDLPPSPGGVSTELNCNTSSQHCRIAQRDGSPAPTPIGSGTRTLVGINIRGVILPVLLLSRCRQSDPIPRLLFFPFNFKIRASGPIYQNLYYWLVKHQMVSTEDNITFAFAP